MTRSQGISSTCAPNARPTFPSRRSAATAISASGKRFSTFNPIAGSRFALVSNGCRLNPDKDDGGYAVTCRDLPEAITHGETIAQALIEAADCLEEAIAASR